ncbi:MAG: 23S rRNA (adenine(2503)-C(2))-methyltransferase RlmN [Clostridiales bacterium]|nr:23S rRNA (adenine(2503)-C(2))-methyltransferase RlmN [Clostridiales bacterium]
MKDAREDILGLMPHEIVKRLQEMGEQAFRGKQVINWLYKGVISFEDMTNLSKATRKKLEDKYIIGSVKLLEKRISKNGDTIKYLCLLADHNIIECVVMKYNYGNTLCLSTQVGCRMGCSFCASTKQGLVRDLEVGEMMAQVVMANTHIKQTDERGIRNIVLMGSGEPLDNYSNVIKFLRLVNHPEGLNISYRNITLSTCGLVPKMKRLAQENIPITLSISLHAPNDELRKKIMPVASAYSVDEIIEAGKYFFEKTGRRVTFEYSLIDRLNDNVYDAKELASKIKGFPCHVNVIPINEIEDMPYKRSSESRIKVFVQTLKTLGVQVTRRRELGQDIEGACGQLKRSYLDSLDK